MEELINVENIEKKQRKDTICGISIWRIYSYFIVYSFLGYVIETLFQITKRGIFESKKSFLYGPFCAIYGIGAILIIIAFKNYKKNKAGIFVGGIILGTIAEYIVSLILEKIFGVIWWDYSNMPFNINGRVCAMYSVFWGILSLVLILYINPGIDKFLNIIKNRFSFEKQKIITSIMMIFLLIDAIITCFALYFFNIRIVHNYDLQVANKIQIEEQYEKIYNNEFLTNIIYKYFDDEKMMRTFPAIKITDKNGNVIYLREILSDIQTYYYRFNF